ncbi:MAG: glutamate--tRNA ligase [Pseudomonadota bacterium]
MTTVRFAPSPTGYLHIGNIRTALINWCVAKRAGGTFILRLDDTDAERSEERFAEAIIEDLAWAGITPDKVFRQSERIASYDAVAEKLRSQGLLYGCYESADELETKRRRLRTRRLPPVYDRAGLDLSDDERNALEGEGRSPHWRFKLGGGTVAWDDGVRGHQTIDLPSISDPVLVRADDSYLYTLPSIIDDIEMGVTHVIRGEDHVANTGVQIDIFRALGAEAPIFAHHNLLVRADGEALSKRTGDMSIRSLREAGYEPQTIAALALFIGSSLPVDPALSAEEMIETFDLSTLSRAPARFDPADLPGLNAKRVHALAFAEVSERLEAFGVGGGEAFWQAIAANLETVEEASHWWQLIETDDPADLALDATTVSAEDSAFAQQAIAHLPADPWDGETWGGWTAALKDATGRKGRGLFMPLRLALTGRERGPELAPLLPLIGRRRTLDRLRALAGSPSPDS